MPLPWEPPMPEGLPPRGRQQMGAAVLPGAGLFYGAAPIVVRTKGDLSQALRQHERRVVIKNPNLARPFEYLLWVREVRWLWFGTLALGLLYWALYLNYGVNLRGTWDVSRSGSMEIILTPAAPTAPKSPPPPSGEE
jgi:hypothetical protein